MTDKPFVLRSVMLHGTSAELLVTTDNVPVRDGIDGPRIGNTKSFKWHDDGTLEVEMEITDPEFARVLANRRETQKLLSRRR